jgi:8-oxo-dGTP diphosphatase
MERVSTAGVVRRGKRFLLALRRPGTSIGESWEFPGGKVRAGEEPEQTLKREFHEELEIDIIVGKLLCTGDFSNRGTDYHLQAYDVKLLSEGFTLAEHQNTGWFTLSEMVRLPMAESDRSIVECIRNSSQEKNG